MEKEIIEKQKISFIEDCIKFFQGWCLKLIKKSLLNYKIVAAVSALDPSHMISSKVNIEKIFKSLVEIIYEREWITLFVVDGV